MPMADALRDAEKKPGPVREVIVRPLDARRETVALLVALALIVALMAFRFTLISTSETQLYMRSYQRLDEILQDDPRSMYQSLLTAVKEVADLRDLEGLWPESELLELEGVPPFDTQLVVPALRNYVWSAHDGISWVDYVGGDPKAEEGFSFILRLIDLHADYHPHPHPGLDYDPKQQVAAQIWVYPEPYREYPGERLPEAGWWWVVGPDDPSLKAPPKPTGPVAPAASPQNQEGSPK
jgi:hypothetical protein